MESPVQKVVVFRSRRHPESYERALVLKSREIEHELQFEFGEWLLLVPESVAGRAERELDDYQLENRNWPRKPEPLVLHSNGAWGVAGYIGVLLFITVIVNNDSFGLGWYSAGKVDAGRIVSGEWWRTFTGLTLHLDFGHLVANLAFGAVFGLFVGQLLGSGLAWASILVAGALGNALNSVFQDPSHTAVGASTAIFGALGLLGAYVWRRRRHLEGRWAMRWAPIIGAVALLAYTGTGGERTDVGAHLTGFASGALLGVLFGRTESELIPAARGQQILGVSALVLLGLAWAVALAEAS